MEDTLDHVVKEPWQDRSIERKIENLQLKRKIQAKLDWDLAKLDQEQARLDRELQFEHQKKSINENYLLFSPKKKIKNTLKLATLYSTNVNFKEQLKKAKVQSPPVFSKQFVEN